MAIRTREGTGQHFISAPKVRSKRYRYEKTPLVGEQRGLIAWLAKIFGRRSRPFIGSAIADRIDRGLGFSRRVADSDAAQLTRPGSTLVESVAGQLHEFAVAATNRADNALDEIDDSLRQEAAWLDECRPDGIVSALRTKLEKLLIHLPTAMVPLARKLIAAKITVEDFKRRNGLSEDLPYGKRFDLAVIGQVGILLGIEFIANALFQSDTQATGVIGGVLVATLTSLATIIIGILFAFGFQRIHRAAQGGGVLGYSLIALACVLSFIFVSSLSLIRVAGETGDLHPLETARMQLMADPLAGVKAMLDLPAFAYTICIVALIVSVARKYLDYAGAFPGYRKRVLEFKNAEDALECEYEATVDEAHETVEEQNGYLDSAPGFIASCKVPIQTLVADHENAIDQFRHDADDVRTAARLFDAFIADRVQSGDIARATHAVTVIADRTTALLDDYTAKLVARHTTFAESAEDLCLRDDVSDATVEDARARFAQEMESTYAALADRKRDLLDTALADYKRDKSWLSDVLMPAATATTA